MSFEKLLAEAQKKFGNSARKGTDILPVEVIPTGIPSLDIALGVGGWPRGGIAQVFGPESAGKSALSYLAIAEAQRLNLEVALIDLEGSFQPDWATKLGVNPEKILILSPVSAEETATYAVWCANNPDIDLQIIDSIGAMASEREMEDEGKKQAYGQSGIITQMVKQLNPRLLKNNQACLLINQVRDTANSRNLPILHSPGGHALQHACSVIVQLRPGPTVYKYKFEIEGEQPIGYRPIATIKKNKLAPPGRNAEWDFYHTENPDFSVGIDYADSLANAAIQIGTFEKESAAIFTYKDERLRGKSGIISYFKEHPEEIDNLRNLFYKKIEERKNGEVHTSENE